VDATDLAFSPDGRHLAVTAVQGSTHTLTLWDLETPGED
jgi:hypothetical protein